MEKTTIGTNNPSHEDRFTMKQRGVLQLALQLDF
jgi:hypothetical protein